MLSDISSSLTSLTCCLPDVKRPKDGGMNTELQIMYFFAHTRSTAASEAETFTPESGDLDYPSTSLSTPPQLSHQWSMLGLNVGVP